jgi:hypothetical protein
MHARSWASFRHTNVALFPMPSGAGCRPNVSVYANCTGQVSHLLPLNGMGRVTIGCTGIWNEAFLSFEAHVAVRILTVCAGRG